MSVREMALDPKLKDELVKHILYLEGIISMWTEQTFSVYLEDDDDDDNI
jgi:hypothetical protein